MSLTLIRVVSNLYMQSLIIYVSCKTLHMRSNVAFVLLSMAGTAAGIVMQELQILPMVRALLVAPLVCFVLPIALSTDSLPYRLGRCAILAMLMLVASFVTSVLFLAFRAPIDAGVIEGELLYKTILIHIAAAAVNTIASFTIVREFGVSVAQRDEALEPSFIVLLFCSYVVCIFLSNQAAQHSSNPLCTAAAVMDLLCCLLSLGLTSWALKSARQDARERRAQANRDATTQQLQLVQDEVEALAQRSLMMRRLRHDLANQIDVVTELATSGNARESDLHLQALQAYAHELTEFDNA